MSLKKFKRGSLLDKHEQATVVQTVEEAKALEEVKRSEEAKARKTKVK